MKKTERMRQAVSGPLEAEKLKEHTEKGWKLVAIEWEREVETPESGLPSDVPFGLHIAPDTQRLETNPAEREILIQLMELIVQEGSYARIADEINRRSEEHTSELQSHVNLVCRLLLEKKKKKKTKQN